MKVLVLTRNAGFHSVRRLGEELLRAGHEALIQDPDGPEALKQRPDFILPRLGHAGFDEAVAVLEYFERRRVPVLNGAAGLREARNKWIAHLVLREEGVPLPATGLHRRADLPREYPYVAKIPEPVGGAGSFLVRGAEDLMGLPDGEWMASAIPREGGVSGGGRDYRVLVLDGRVVAAMERRFAPEALLSFFAEDAEAVACFELSSSVREAAVSAAGALRLRFAGVDIMMSDAGPVVLDVDANPPFEGIEEVTGVNVAATIVAVINAGRPA